MFTLHLAKAGLSVAVLESRYVGFGASGRNGGFCCLGGGMLLLALLPMFIAPSLIIPIHAVAQLASNSSRMLFSFSQVQWALLPKFLLGSLLGTVFFGYFLFKLPTDYLPLAIGCYILLRLWSKRFSEALQRYESYYLIGFLQTGLGLIVGATGPLSLTILSKQLKSNEQVIATSALFMSISHLAKFPVYFSISSDLAAYSGLIIAIALAAVVGSLLAKTLRLKLQAESLAKLMKVLLSLLALQMIARTLITVA